MAGFAIDTLTVFYLLVFGNAMIVVILVLYRCSPARKKPCNLFTLFPIAVPKGRFLAAQASPSEPEGQS